MHKHGKSAHRVGWGKTPMAGKTPTPAYLAKRSILCHFYVMVGLNHDRRRRNNCKNIQIRPGALVIEHDCFLPRKL